MKNRRLIELLARFPLEWDVRVSLNGAGMAYFYQRYHERWKMGWFRRLLLALLDPMPEPSDYKDPYRVIGWAGHVFTRPFPNGDGGEIVILNDFNGAGLEPKPDPPVVTHPQPQLSAGQPIIPPERQLIDGRRFDPPDKNTKPWNGWKKIPR
jgi:hypothetical protein